ncbi:MAG: DUF4335 domain-containing protein [Geminocystis sp.]|nr:DUF4335 domain-containing protein [Geminocystis sp.]HIK36411.1 DUF4335 domain-containing protein [Geminocystis sp. M7585_C2015_104]MCS7148006.1 DUF4335 domain-containing protein [Geminocystis sp.]MCX8078981.1 DUF4335 domain-containing protein [Geminocystis sp.]MDW8116914.1 DUF4335 domain-containing protein [Geminocystis sp.]
MSQLVERVYTSPNCILSLQGFAQEEKNNQTPLPTMSVVSLVNLQIVGHPLTLQGGLVFLEHLLRATSAYCQQFLSGLPHPVEFADNHHHISFSFIPERKRHLLTWQPEKDNIEKQWQIELTTVQLFDLLDTLDQLIVDPYTLPQLRDEVKPLPRHYKRGEKNPVEQSAPAALGFVFFAAAAVVLFLMPHPSTIKDPNQEPRPPRNETSQPVAPIPLETPKPGQ